MKKKLLCGFSAMAAAASVFWACGEGNINGKNVNDEIVNASSEEDMKAFKEQAMKDCKDDINCYGKHQGYLDGTEVPTSSATPASSATNPVSSSSATKPNPVTSSSSLSIVVRSSSSESDIVVSSSSEPASSSAGTASGLGQCFPTVNGEKVKSVQKNEAFKWWFKPANSMVFDTKGGTFTWVYGDGAEVGTDANGKYSASVKYAAANTYTATVTALLNGNSEDIPCTIKVTGIPITGCKCEGPEKVDISTGGLASWTVSGCTPLTETFTYTWPAGVTGDGATGTFTFTEKGQTLEPVVNVKTAESDVDVPCSLVKAYDAKNVEEKLVWEQNKTLSEPGTYTLTGCGSETVTGEKDVQITTGSSDDCLTWLGATAWNGHWGTCNGQTKLTFPVTFELPEGGSITMGNCW